MTNPNKLADALDHIARVALGSRKQTTRLQWIVARAKSALEGHEGWKDAKRPFGYHDALERSASLAEHDAQPAPGEWVMVPKVPTEAMIEAAEIREDDEPLSDWGETVRAPHEAIYAAMLAAAPQPAPAPVQVDEFEKPAMELTALRRKLAAAEDAARFAGEACDDNERMHQESRATLIRAAIAALRQPVADMSAFIAVAERIAASHVAVGNALRVRSVTLPVAVRDEARDAIDAWNALIASQQESRNAD